MKPFRLLTAAVIFAALAPRLAQRGMFLDGITYASISRNLAAGRGHFWTPSYTATLQPAFYEHPPLGFWLQSLWFRAFGDHLFVERAYTATVALGTALVIAMLWRRLTAGLDARRYEWLPLLLWIAVPLVSWSIVGNLLETTVSFFTTAAVLALLASQDSASAARSLAWGGLSGLCITAAFLTKGPVGLFPLAAPAIFRVTHRVGRRDLGLGWAAQWAVVALSAAVLLALAEPRASLGQYLNQQVLASILGQREVSPDSFGIVKWLLQGVWLPMLAAILLIILAARTFVQPTRDQQRNALRWTLLGLAGTLPILISSRQTGHYLIPAVPFYAIAAAFIIVPTMAQWTTRTGAKRRLAINVVTALVAGGAIVAMFLPAIARDPARLADLDAIADAMPRDTTIGICPSVVNEWGLHAWFERRFAVSLGVQERPAWFLKTAVTRADCLPSTCVPATDAARDLVLMKCRP